MCNAGIPDPDVTTPKDEAAHKWAHSSSIQLSRMLAADNITKTLAEKQL